MWNLPGDEEFILGLSGLTGVGANGGWDSERQCPNAGQKQEGTRAVSQTSKRPRRLSPRKPALPFARAYVHAHVRITLTTGSTWKCGAGALLIWSAGRSSESRGVVVLTTRGRCTGKNNQRSILESTPVTDVCNLLVYVKLWIPTLLLYLCPWTLDLCLQNGKHVTRCRLWLLLPPVLTRIGGVQGFSSISMVDRAWILWYRQSSHGPRATDWDKTLKATSWVFLFCLFFLAAPGGLWDLSSPTTNRTRTPCGGSPKS